MTTSSRDIAVQTGYDTGIVATMLRRILAWLDQRALPMPAEEVEEAPVIELIPEPIPEPEPDDGLMKPESIIRAAGNLLWAYRGSLDIAVDIDETAVDGQMHSATHPTATIRLPGGVTIRIPTFGSGYGEIIAPDGQKQPFSNHDKSIAPAWRTIQVQTIIDTLGLEDLMVREPDDDGEIPHESHGDALSEALGRFVESHAPRQSECRYLSRQMRRRRTGKDDYETYYEEIETTSSWLEIGEGVLMRIVVDRDRHYTGSGQYVHTDTSHLVIKHPVVGSIRLPHKPVVEGLERRRLMSLTSALGIVHEMPVHLPMPRGNAQAARVLRLCREAVAVEPDLVDSSGTPIRPLVDQHLPELMKRHAAAAAIAPADELAEIDAELAEGIERVRLAVEDALSSSAVARRTALRSQLGFLALRHPDPVPLLESIPERTAA